MQQYLGSSSVAVGVPSALRHEYRARLAEQRAKSIGVRYAVDNTSNDQKVDTARQGVTPLLRQASHRQTEVQCSKLHQELKKEIVDLKQQCMELQDTVARTGADVSRLDHEIQRQASGTAEFKRILHSQVSTITSEFDRKMQDQEKVLVQIIEKNDANKLEMGIAERSPSRSTFAVLNSKFQKDRQGDSSFGGLSALMDYGPVKTEEYNPAVQDLHEKMKEFQENLKATQMMIGNIAERDRKEVTKRFDQRTQELQTMCGFRIEGATARLESLVEQNQAQMQQAINTIIQEAEQQRDSLQNQVIAANDKLENCLSRVSHVENRACEAEKRIKDESEANITLLSKICDETKKTVHLSFEQHRSQIDSQVNQITQDYQQLKGERKDLQTFDNKYLEILCKLGGVEKVIQAIPGLNFEELLRSSDEQSSGHDIQTPKWAHECVRQGEQTCMDKTRKDLEEAKKELESLGIQLRNVQQELMHQSAVHAAQASHAVERNDSALKRKIEEANEGARTCSRRLNTMEQIVSDLKHDFEKLKEKPAPKVTSSQGLLWFASVAQPQSDDARDRIREIEKEIMQYFADSTKTVEDRTKFVRELNKHTHPDKPGGSHEVQLWFQEWQKKFKSWFIDGRQP